MYKVTVVLSTNLCTKYLEGVPLDNLLARPEYVARSVLVRAESASDTVPLPVLYVASNISAIA